MEENVDVSIIIVSFNTRLLTYESIESIFNQTLNNITFEIILIDNNSDDGTVDYIKNNFPTVIIVDLDYNAGFALANNIASKYAKGRYLLLLNPDTIILDSAINKIVSFADKNEQYSIYGGATFFKDLSRNPTSGYQMGNYWSLFCTATGLSSLFRTSRFFSSESLAWWDWQSIKEVDIVTGCFALIRRTLWEELRGFDTMFYIYGEDADLSLRAKRITGKNCVLIPDVKIIHYGGASEKNRTDKLIRLLKAKQQLYYKHWKKINGKYALIMMTLWPFGRMIYYYITSVFTIRKEEDFHIWKEVWMRRREWSLK